MRDVLDPGQWRALIDWRAEALTLMLITAESAILYLYLGVLLPVMRPPYDPFPFWLILALMLVAYFVPHVLDLERVFGSRYETILLLAVILSLLLTIKVAAFPEFAWAGLGWPRAALQGLILRPDDSLRPVWALVAVVAYAWWRGRTRAEPALDAAYQMLRWGTMATALGLFLVLFAAPAISPLDGRASLAVVGYFSATLAAVGFARLRLEGIRSSSPLGPNWLGTFAAPIVAIVLIALLGVALLSHEVLETTLYLLSPLFWVIGMLVRLLVVMVALLAFVIIAPLLWLLEREGLGHMSGDRLPQLVRSLNQISAFAASRISLSDPLRYLIVGLVLFLLGSALTRYLYRRRRHWRQTTREQRESVFVLEDALGGLTRRLRRLFRPARRPDSLAGLRGDPRWAHTVAIRETYRRMQSWGARSGVAQEPDETAEEYEPELAARFPSAGDAIGAIVDAYNVARYSGQPASAAEAETVRQAWAALRARGR